MRTRSQRNQPSAAIVPESQVKATKVTFGDDDDDDHVQVPTPASAPVQDEDDAIHASAPVSEDEQEQEDEDAPVEVVSTKASKKQAAAEANKIKAEQKAAQEKRRQAEQERLEKRAQVAPKKQKQTQKQTQKQDELPSPEPAENTQEDDEAGPSRLDPSLFAAAFAPKPKAPKSILKPTAHTAAELKRKRNKGLAKGRDGMPMRRLADGTIVRSLSSASSKKTNFDSPTTSDSASAALDPVLRPTVLDPTTSLPSAKVRGYKKRKLGLVASAPVPKKATPLPSKSAGKSQDDPLGLNDPEFMPGGKFHRQKQKLTGSARRRDPKNSGAGQPGALARQGFRGAGGRKDALSTLSSRPTGASLGFARSLS